MVIEPKKKIPLINIRLFLKALVIIPLVIIVLLIFAWLYFIWRSNGQVERFVEKWQPITGSADLADFYSEASENHDLAPHLKRWADNPPLFFDTSFATLFETELLGASDFQVSCHDEFYSPQIWCSPNILLLELPSD